jgi:2-polyprenyl-3-methyl-5-hydroxy-6-metoxy-1,4-benzoquinol methylase
MSATTYIGTELDVFGQARNWKRYLRDLATPYLSGDVLEVGGGIGETSYAFRSEAQSSWTALEPDWQLAARLQRRVAGLRQSVRVVAGTIRAIENGPLFDAVIYIDVLEHIKQDREELREAAARLRPGGTIVVLSPAHQSLFAPFDQAIGHFRRYDRRQLRTLTPPASQLIRLEYVDAVGLLLSIGNRLLLRSASPTLSQVLFWDRYCVPAARRIDPLLGRRVGKSIFAVWRRD